MKLETIELPTELVNNALERLKAHQTRKNVFDFCLCADRLGFTKEQVIKMLSQIPGKKPVKQVEVVEAEGAD
jgi:hypothetical protein